MKEEQVLGVDFFSFQTGVGSSHWISIWHLRILGESLGFMDWGLGLRG